MKHKTKVNKAWNIIHHALSIYVEELYKDDTAEHKLLDNALAVLNQEITRAEKYHEAMTHFYWYMVDNWCELSTENERRFKRFDDEIESLLKQYGINIEHDTRYHAMKKYGVYLEAPCGTNNPKYKSDNV